MSGVVGIFNRNGAPVTRGEILTMARTLERRGPDGTGAWCNGPVGLGHTMLHTTPESLYESLPFVTAGGALAVTGDVRLDNRAELIRLLRLDGRDPLTLGDNELILAAYEKWGDACAEQLLGAFAFAIWDGRRQRLFCARDHIGIKPFCYFLSDRYFVFASEVKAIVALPQTPQRINEGRIADYFENMERIDKRSTFFEDIVKLPPARTLVIDQDRSSLQRYWSLDPGREVYYATREEYTEAFREIFSEAVRCRMRGVAPVASMLSGGIDSSAIVAVGREIAAARGTEPLPIFSAIAADKSDNVESQAIRAVIQQGGVNACTIQPQQIGDFAAELDWLQNHTHDLFLSVSMILPVYASAHRQGLNVVMDGIDGDVVASLGNYYLAHLLRAGDFGAAVAEANARALNYWQGTKSARELLYHSGRRAFLPPAWRRMRQALRRQSDPAPVNPKWINDDFARRIDLAARHARLGAEARPIQPKFDLFDTLNAAHAHVIDLPNLAVGLERYDRVAASQSIEPRHPILDKRLVEFCLALPWDQKVHGGYSKITLRESMSGSLPDSVRWRSDWENLGSTFYRAWFRQRQPAMTQTVEGQIARVAEYLDVAKVQRACRELVAQGQSDDAYMLFRIETLIKWLGRVHA